MAEIILTPFLQVIFEKLANPVVQKFADFCHVQDRFKELQRTLPMAQAVIQGAEERQIRDEAVRIWLRRLKDAAWKAEDLLEEFMYNNYNQHRINIIKTGRIRDFYEKGNILDDLQKAVVEGINLPLVGSNIMDREFEMRETSSFFIGSEVYGREEEKREILEKLLMPSGEGNVQVISIVGIPGIGKSTLAKMIYNDDEVKKCFDLRIWVFVSRDFSAKRIIKAAIESVTGNRCDLTELDALQSKLWHALQKKKYLLLLDDVWNQDPEEWDKLRPLFLSSRVKGSKVLVTTRYQKVALLIGSSNSAYHLKGLCEGDLWALLKNRAFLNQEEEEKHKSLLAVGEEIIRKCRGMPLAAKVLGGLLRFKREEKDWLHVQNSELWDLGVYKEGILPAVILSYLHLPPHLKHCFAFCSIFPKDYDIQREKLIHMWMAHDFIISDGGSKPVEDIGDEYFDELLWMSVFEKVNDCEGGSTGGYKMNDVFYSLAKSITDSEFVVLEKGLARRNLGQVYHASIVSDYGSFTIPETLHQAKHLRTLLILSEGGFQTVPSDIFSSFTYLRMLILSGSLVKLPESIGKLSILKSLDLSNSHFDELPSALSSLCLLETLNLSGCYNLKRLPSMHKITGLRHLNISGCEALMEMPDGIDKLAQLQTLPIYIVPIPLRKHISLEGITRLKRLNLRGELKIKHLERLHDIRVPTMVKVLDKKYLQSLGLCWGNAGSDFIMNPSALESNAARFQQRKPHESGPSEDPEPSHPTVSDPGLAWEVLACLQPHKNLKKLFIVGYPGIKFAGWTLPNLTEVVLINCGGCLHLPILGHLPLLRSLRMEGIKSIVYVGQEIYGEDVEVSFPSLQELFMKDFPVLKKWVRSPDGKESFPKLRKLILNDCPNLISMPYFASLEHLELRRCCSILLNCMEDLTLLSTLVIYGLDELLCLPRKLIRNNRLLKHVRISSCPKLRSLTSEFGNLASLTFLSIHWCEDLTLLSEEFENLTSLEVLEIGDCYGMKALPENLMGSFKSLQDLSIENCSSLETISFGFQPLTALKHLTIMYCPRLAALPNNLENLSGLLSLTVISCPLIEYLPEGIKNLKKLGSLEIRSCPRLKGLPEWLDCLASSLTTFTLSDCHSLKSLPLALRRLIKLQQLTIQDCPDLQRRCQEDTGEDWWKISHIRHQYIFSCEPQQSRNLG
ncbi:Apoptotic ATPase [Handroanthus impetiginosus]|uniref:Apoptotic ATPase n=1 Tax=Handroanthus impetiginosus TaxID=429701 RepID=A0A2G9H1A7_9LAMI|nr:Apoptotic ATPase [Handroanthus impetiginosus]